MSIFSFTKKRRPPPLRYAPEGLRLYAVGDIHGRLDLLRLLLGAIAEDAEGTTAAIRLIFLGDYTDRGPQSREVVETLMELGERRPDASIFLKGNHDDTLLKFVRDPGVGRSWCNYGGAETLESYGVQAPVMTTDAADWERARLEFVDSLGQRGLAFFEALPPFVEFGDYFFVHAGVRPGVPLDEQDEKDLLWIRDDFLRPREAMEKAIVHGHTPEADAFVSARRIGIDTGAYASGVLTAVVLEGAERRLIQARIQSGSSSVHHVEIASPAAAGV